MHSFYLIESGLQQSSIQLLKKLRKFSTEFMKSNKFISV